jgi:hypothetical protein
MVQYIPRMKASLLLSLALFAGACAKSDNTAAADSALNKDIQLANRDTAAQPALNHDSHDDNAHTNHDHEEADSDVERQHRHPHECWDRGESRDDSRRCDAQPRLRLEDLHQQQQGR